MAETTEQVVLDRAQVKKAVQALQAFLKSNYTPDTLFLDETQQISLLFTLWKIPREAQTIRIPLPHGQRSDTDEVCLFTRDEPNMTSDQTQRFYKRLLEEKGVQNVTEIIPYKVLKTEYKSYEAKRRLAGNFDLFLSDDRVRRLLPTHIGRHFYDRKREPLPVNLQSKYLANDIKSLIQGTKMKITNRGGCCMARIAHSGMTADEITENIEAAVKTVVAKLRTKGPVMKIIHLKSQASVALPIYTSDFSHLNIIEDAQKQAKTERKVAKKRRAKSTTDDTKKVDGDDEEIPQLVPIATPSKKAKLQQQPKKKGLTKAPKPAVQKTGQKAQAKLTRKAGKNPSHKQKRKAPKKK
ncbi:ribosomal L1 domain-containing protein 1 isoform 2-T2 [Polymixia lowei]